MCPGCALLPCCCQGGYKGEALRSLEDSAAQLIESFSAALDVVLMGSPGPAQLLQGGGQQGQLPGSDRREDVAAAAI